MLMFRVRSGLVFLSAALIIIVTSGPTDACTGIRVKTKDGAVIMARTMEFGIETRTQFIVIPRGKTYQGTAPAGQPGLKWTTKYGTVGASALGLPHLGDGMNEKGLGVGLFYFPGYVKYQDVTEATAAKAVAPWELGTYLLTTCADAGEAVKAAKAVLVGATVLEEWQFTPPFHYVVHDRSGNCFVLEHVGGKLTVHANPLGVITNSPTFDWHLTNLRNYLNLSVTNVPPIEVGKLKLSAFGQGSGLLGLPGDFTPPSRFVRAVAFSQAALPVDKGEDGVRQAFHILNQFDIPKGAIREKHEGKEVSNYTQWTSAADLKNGRYYFRTYDHQNLRMIDLQACDFAAKDVKTVPNVGKDEIEDVTGKAK